MLHNSLWLVHRLTRIPVCIICSPNSPNEHSLARIWLCSMVSLIHSCFNAGQPSATFGQHWNSNVSCLLGMYYLIRLVITNIVIVMTIIVILCKQELTMPILLFIYEYTPLIMLALTIEWVCPHSACVQPNIHGSCSDTNLDSRPTRPKGYRGHTALLYKWCFYYRFGLRRFLRNTWFLTVKGCEARKVFFYFTILREFWLTMLKTY